MDDKYSQALIMNLLAPHGPKELPVKPVVTPEHVQTEQEINFDETASQFIKEIGNLYNEYVKTKKETGGHASAWDKVTDPNQGRQELNMEMRLELNRMIRQNNPNYFKEASYENALGSKFARFMESRKPFRKRRHRKGRDIYQKKPFNFTHLMGTRREELISFGMKPELVDEVIAENQKKNYLNLKIVADQNSLPEAINELSESNILVAANTIAKTGDGFMAKAIRVEEPEHKAKSLAETKVCVVGFPSKKRSDMAKKLSNYYGVPLLTLKDMLNKIIEYGIMDKRDLEDAKENLSELGQFVFSEIDSRYDGYVLEGYPFDYQQALTSKTVDALIFVDFPIDEYAQFQNKKRWCPACMASYHMEKHPPKQEGYCSRCGTMLTIQKLDNEKVIKNRYDKWRRTINAILKHFKEIHKDIKIGIDTNIDDAATDIERTFTEWKVRLY
jgi:adenylate kinase